MNWEAIGAIGEVFGGIAVLATLVYLAVQVRQAKKQIALTGIQERARSVLRFPYDSLFFATFSGFLVARTQQKQAKA